MGMDARTGETDPTRPDTDGDGLLDGAEDPEMAEGAHRKRILCQTIRMTGSPMVAIGTGTAYDRLTKQTDHFDTDDDGLLDGIEDLNRNGRVDPRKQSAPG